MATGKNYKCKGSFIDDCENEYIENAPFYKNTDRVIRSLMREFLAGDKHPELTIASLYNNIFAGAKERIFWQYYREYLFVAQTIDELNEKKHKLENKLEQTIFTTDDFQKWVMKITESIIAWHQN